MQCNAVSGEREEMHMYSVVDMLVNASSVDLQVAIVGQKTSRFLKKKKKKKRGLEERKNTIENRLKVFSHHIS